MAISRKKVSKKRASPAPYDSEAPEPEEEEEEEEIEEEGSEEEEEPEEEEEDEEDDAPELPRSGRKKAARRITRRKATKKTTRKAAAKKATRKAGRPSFMKRGKAAREEMARAQARRRVGSGWRFWIPKGEDKYVTFLDGGLDDEGLLDVVAMYEHNVPFDGRMAQVRCVGRQEGPDGHTEVCPICEAPDNPAYVAFFTVLEHLEEPFEKDGVEHWYAKRLYAATSGAFDQLTKQAVKAAKKHGTDGLVGVTFEIGRSNKHNSPRVGDSFDAEAYSIEDINEIEGLEEFELLDDADLEPIDYEESEDLKWLTAAEIEEMGLHQGVGKRDRDESPRRKRGKRARSAASKL